MTLDGSTYSAGWLKVDVRGVVQGVGFRPAVYRVATSMCLDGYVENTSCGATIHLRASRPTVRKLLGRVRATLPPMASIEEISISPGRAPRGEWKGFRIAPSSHGDEGSPARISPDIAICKECLADFTDSPRRRDYPLTNCTNCGPRFSITTSVPYDRPSTTMAPFLMCMDCANEYSDPADRRFHAQPIACNNCGPAYSLHLPDGRKETDFNTLADCCASILRRGELVMVKGMGGYNIFADATSCRAVGSLRSLKHRPRKPFAVMAANMPAARLLAQISPAEEIQLASWRAPIVVCRALPDNGLAPEVAPGYSTIGVMLPYMAFHHRLLRLLGRPIVVTSANFPGSPIIASDSEAHRFASGHSLPLVSYNREIVNRSDDSVVRIADGAPRIIRRSRGYVPEPVGPSDLLPGIAGMGADITSAWAFSGSEGIILGQYIGSLLSEGGQHFLRESIHNMSHLTHFSPGTVAIDAHPRYESSRIGRELAAGTGARIVEVWHHHAHVLSVMGEYGLTGEVIAIVLDGAGAGPDGTVWGAELLRCSRTGFSRLGHGPYLPLPGGDVASLQPWRMAVALTEALKRPDLLPQSLISSVGEENIAVVRKMIARNINCPRSCGAGRLFDAVAALLGLAYDNGYESEGPILLENAAAGISAIPYPVDSSAPLALSFLPGMLEEIASGERPEKIAAKFHDSYADSWATAAGRACAESGLRRVVLAGGVMANTRLASRIACSLRAAGLEVYTPLAVPPGDGGIAVGQIIYASSLSCTNFHSPTA